MYPQYMQFNLAACHQPISICNNPKFKPFRNCLGSLDGVFVPVQVPANMQSNYRSRKGIIAQNVMAAVNFNSEFVFVLAGWEGSAHDTRVFNDAITKGFRIPGNKYFLADAGYGIRQGLMTPYRGVRYHLKEQASASVRPDNKKELYNLRHASLRNVVERIFGCIKKKFPILANTPEVELNKQVRLIYALCCLWNFIRKHETEEMMFEEYTPPEVPNSIKVGVPLNHQTTPSAQDDAHMKSRRDRLASKLWEQYRNYTSSRAVVDRM